MPQKRKGKRQATPFAYQREKSSIINYLSEKKKRQAQPNLLLFDSTVWEEKTKEHRDLEARYKQNDCLDKTRLPPLPPFNNNKEAELLENFLHIAPWNRCVYCVPYLGRKSWNKYPISGERAFFRGILGKNLWLLRTIWGIFSWLLEIRKGMYWKLICCTNERKSFVWKDSKYFSLQESLLFRIDSLYKHLK